MFLDCRAEVGTAARDGLQAVLGSGLLTSAGRSGCVRLGRLTRVSQLGSYLGGAGQRGCGGGWRRLRLVSVSVFVGRVVLYSVVSSSLR